MDNPEESQIKVVDPNTPKTKVLTSAMIVYLNSICPEDLTQQLSVVSRLMGVYLSTAFMVSSPEHLPMIKDSVIHMLNDLIRQVTEYKAKEGEVHTFTAPPSDKVH